MKIKHYVEDVPMQYHDMMMHRRVEGKFHTFLTSTLDLGQ
jgi:hypothetical protein